MLFETVPQKIDLNERPRFRPEGRENSSLTSTGRPVSQHEEGVLFEFSLPVGCYATSVLREFAKCDLSQACDSGDDSDGDRTVEAEPVIERNGKKGVRFAASRAEAGRGRRLERWLVDKEGKRGDPPRLRAKACEREVCVRRQKNTVDYDEVT